MSNPGESRLKKHIPSTDHVGWTVRYPLFETPTRQELTDCRRLGAGEFACAHPGTHLYPDPFLRRKASESRFLLDTLVLVPGQSEESRGFAERVAAKVLHRYGDKLPVIPIAELAGGLHADRPLLLLGDADTHPLCAQIAKKYQIGLFCKDHPGTGAWGITTHWELEPGMPPRYQLTCDAKTEETAIRCFLTTAVKGEIESRLCWVHQISALPALPGLCGGFQQWIHGRHGWNPIFRDWFAVSARETSYREFFLNWFQKNFPKYLPYNAPLLDLGIDAIRYYQFTADPAALALFREMLAGYGDLLAEDAPDLYVSDLDFRLGTLCNYWNWVRYHPGVTEQECREVSVLLLGLTRMMVGYFENHWKDKPGPHNHQTFKARSMIQAWRFFGFYEGVPDREEWKAAADRIFTAIPHTAYKFRENATQYETFVPEHLLVWQEVTGVGRSREQRSSLVQGALRQWTVRDSFLLPVEYGDAYPIAHPVRPPQIFPWLSGDAREESRLLSLEAGPGCTFPFEFPTPIQSFQALPSVTAKAADLPQPETGWSRQSLDPSFVKNYGITGNAESLFDKLAWRSGWESDATYLAIEGIGRGNRAPFVGHAHHEANSILRMNLGGRIWLVNNGYGKQEGAGSAREAFNTRQIGPVDHNTLVIRNLEEACTVEPPAIALLLHHAQTPFPCSTTALENYGGVFWKRHLLIPHPHCLLVIDEVLPAPTVENSQTFELQWNILGKRLEARDARETARFEQNGAILVFDHFGTGLATWEESTISCWRNLIQSGQYPHTSSLPNHGIVRKVGGPSPEEPSMVFVSGFWLDGVVSKARWVATTRKLSLQMDRPFEREGTTASPLGTFHLPKSHLEIQLS